MVRKLLFSFINFSKPGFNFYSDPAMLTIQMPNLSHSWEKYGNGFFKKTFTPTV